MPKQDKPNTAPPGGHEGKPDRPQRDITLSEEDAQGGAPPDVSIAGEEDPGVGLEFLVKSRQKDEDKDR